MTTTNLGMTIPTVGADADSWGGELNTDLGLIDAFAGSLMPQAEVTLASAATTDIGGAASTAIAISGTTTITSFGAAVNKIRFVRFTGALTLTHNAVTLILPDGSNIITSAGDTCVAISNGSGNWRVFQYQVSNSQSAESNGYKKLGGGLILQWGSFTGTTGSLSGGIAETGTTVTFPVAVSGVLSLTLGVADVSGSVLQEQVCYGALGTTSFIAFMSCRQASTTMQGYYLMIGAL